MRILLLGPQGQGHQPAGRLPGGRSSSEGGGSIAPYLGVLATALRRHGAQVDRIGAVGVPYDPDRGEIWPAGRILDAAHRLLGGVHAAIDAAAAATAGAPIEVIALHHGNLEVEQLLPVLWAEHRDAHRDAGWPAVVHHAHTLAPTLFGQHRPDPALRTAVDQAIADADGLLCFGRYALGRLNRRLRPGTPTAVSPFPTTIPPGTRPAASPALVEALRDLGARGVDYAPLVSLYGYASPWKDPATLLDALTRLDHPMRVLLAGPFWDDPEQAGAELPRPGVTATLGRARLRLVPDYLGPADRAALVHASDAAVFPYRPHPAFQGSGAIGDYLGAGVPVVAADVANMAELLNARQVARQASDLAGDLVPPGDPDALAAALDRYAHPRHLAARTAVARRRTHLFTSDAHARGCLDLYRRATTTIPDPALDPQP